MEIVHRRKIVKVPIAIWAGRKTIEYNIIDTQCGKVTRGGYGLLTVDSTAIYYFALKWCLMGSTVFTGTIVWGGLVF